MQGGGGQPILNIVGTFSESHINENGNQLRQFVTLKPPGITNTLFRTKTFRNILGVVGGQLDYCDREISISF